MGTLQEEQYTFIIISRSFFLRIRNVSDKICRENQSTRSSRGNKPNLCCITRSVREIQIEFHFSENRRIAQKFVCCIKSDVCTPALVQGNNSM
jgi:hypothetical protein